MEFDILKTKVFSVRLLEEVERSLKDFKRTWTLVNAEFEEEDRKTFCENFRDLKYSELERLNENCKRMTSKRQELIKQYQEMIDFSEYCIRKQNEEIRRMRIVQDNCVEELKLMDRKREQLKFKYEESDGEYSPRESRLLGSDKKPILRQERSEKGFKHKVERTNEVNDGLLDRTISKVYERVKATSSENIFDSNVDGWDKKLLCNTIDGKNRLLFIIFPTYYEPFGCFINHPFKKEGWNGDPHSFICCFAEDKFFWVYKFVKNIEERNLLRITSENENSLIEISQFITIQKNPNEGISSVSIDIYKLLETRKGNFIGSFSSRKFRVSRFIVIQFK